MKIRADFVTNSSSSSFTTLLVTAKDGRKFTLYDDEGILYNLEITQDRSRKLHGWGEDASADIESVSDLAKFLFEIRGSIIGDWAEWDSDEEDDDDGESRVVFQELIDSVPTLEAIKEVSFECSEALFGESMDGLNRFLERDLGSNFERACQETPDETLIQKWVGILEDFLEKHNYRLDCGTTEELVKKAFASKELFDMAPDSVVSVTGDTIDFTKFKF